RQRPVEYDRHPGEYRLAPLVTRDPKYTRYRSVLVLVQIAQRIGRPHLIGIHAALQLYRDLSLAAKSSESRRSARRERSARRRDDRLGAPIQTALGLGRRALRLVLRGVRVHRRAHNLIAIRLDLRRLAPGSQRSQPNLDLTGLRRQRFGA